MKDFIRGLMHFPVGLFAAWLICVTPLVGVLFAVGFMFYEALEDWRIDDLSYKDMFGFLIGLGAGGFIASILMW